MKKRYFVLFSFITFIFTVCAGVTGGLLGGYLVSNSQPGEFLNDVAQNVTPDTRVEVLEEESAIIEVVEQANDSVVSIVVTQEIMSRGFFGMSQTRETEVGSGSGFVVSEDGLIITNRHVVAREDATYTVFFADGEFYEAEVIDRDPLLDIAILQIEATDRVLEPLQLGDSDTIKLGQRAIAIGNSLGRFNNSVSAGIISGLSRDIVAASEGGRGAERLNGVIQTDASINPGNSGGPLLDVRGNVIGVNVAVAQRAENVGFAIPIDIVKPAIESVQQNGEIIRPILGVRYEEITPAIAATDDLPVSYGAIIRSGDNFSAIEPGSAADEAGLQEGDIIVQVNGKELKGTVTLRSEIQKLSVGDTVNITYLRDSKRETASVELMRLSE